MKKAKKPLKWTEWWVLKKWQQPRSNKITWEFWDALGMNEKKALRHFERAYLPGERGTFRLVRAKISEVVVSDGDE